MIDAVMISEVIKIDIGQIVETEVSIDKIEVDQGMHKIVEEEILEVMQGCVKILKDHFLETLVKIQTIGVQAIVGPDQHQEQE